MSKRFFTNTELYAYEAMMQELPSARQYHREDNRTWGRYLQMLKCLLDELDYSVVWSRVSEGLKQMLFEDFAFKDTKHRSAFYSAYGKYISVVGKEGVQNDKTAAIYLLSGNRNLRDILSQYLADKTYILLDKVRGIGEEGYDLYHMARKMLGLNTGFFDEDLKEPEIIEDRVLCLYVNALFLQRFGLADLEQDGKRKKPSYNRTGRRHTEGRYNYKNQVVKIKM